MLNMTVSTVTGGDTDQTSQSLLARLKYLCPWLSCLVMLFIGLYSLHGATKHGLREERDKGK